MRWHTITIIVLVASGLAGAPLHGAVAASTSSIDTTLAPYTATHGPGLALLIVDRGRTVHKSGHGWANIAKQIPITPQTQFNIGSLSKQFTAFAILLLEQEGRLRLDDPLTTFFPDTPQPLRAITVRHLLFHLSGLPDVYDLCDRRRLVTHIDVWHRLRADPMLEFPPGTQHDYSNTGYLLLAMIIEKTSDMPYPDFLRERVFAPLGMAQTFVHTATSARQLTHYAVSYGDWPFFEPQADNACRYLYGPGKVITTLDDLEQWIRALRGNGPFAPSLLAKFFQPGTRDDGKRLEYGFGWKFDTVRGIKVIGHTGSWLGFESYIAHVVDKDLWVVILANYNAVPFRRILAAAVR